MIYTSQYSGPQYQPSEEDRLARLGLQMRSTPAFAESLADQTWNSMTESEQAYRMDASMFAREEQGRARQEMYWFEQSEVEFFTNLNEYHDQNMDIVTRTEHYKPEERHMIVEQGLLPYAIPKLRKYALTILGEMAGQETELRAKARTPDQGPFAEAVNSLFRYFDRRSNWRKHKHLCRQDAIVGSRAIAGTRRDPMNLTGSILKRRYRPHEFMWQTRSALDPSLNDCTYFERIFYDLRYNMMVEFPEFAEDIRKFSPLAFSTQTAHIAQLDVLIRPKVQPQSGSTNDVYTHDPFAYFAWRDMIFRREFYRKHPVTKWRVEDPYRGKQADFATKQQAEEWAADCYRFWNNTFKSNGLNTEPMITGSKVVTVNQVEKLTWAGDILVRVEPVGEAFPYELLAPEMLDGSITSYLGHATDVQRMIDRTYTEMDDFASIAKGQTVVNDYFFPNETDRANLDSALVTNDAIHVTMPPQAGFSLEQHVIANIGPRPFPEVITNMMKIAQESADELLGGENFIGQQQSSAESGRAVMARQTAASLALIPYDQEIQDWEERLGRKELQFIQQLDKVSLQTILRQEDPELSLKLMAAFSAHGVESLAEIDLALELVETVASPSTKDRILSQVMTGMQQVPGIADAWSSLALQYIDVDDSIREQVEAKVQQKTQFDQQMQMQQQQHQMSMEQKDMDLKHLNAMVRLKELEIKANPPFTKSLSIDLPATPGMVATVANHAGMEADALGVAQDMSMGTMLRQGERDMQQVHRNKLLMPEEKAALEFKAKQPYRNPTPTVENSTARDDKQVTK